MRENLKSRLVPGEHPADCVEVLDAAPLPTERLEAEICTLAGHLAAAQCRFLVLLAEYDARRGWAAWDMPSCAAWLAWRCQLAPGAAREQVRTARALRDLPLVRAEFAAGRMSYCRDRRAGPPPWHGHRRRRFRGDAVALDAVLTWAT